MLPIYNRGSALFIRNENNSGDPAKGGNMDVLGARAGYSQFFRTKDQPNKPTCAAVQVVLPAGARGALIEIDMVAPRPKLPRGARSTLIAVLRRAQESK